MSMLEIFSAISSQSLPHINFDRTLKSVIYVTMGVVALISVLFVAIGGLKYTLAAGDPQQISKAKDTILYALIGLALAVSAFMLVGFVLSGTQG